MYLSSSTLYIVTLFISLHASNLPTDQQPKSRTTIDYGVVHNGTIMLSKVLKNRYLYIGSVDKFTVQDMTDDFTNIASITWTPDTTNRDFCKMIHDEAECHNFIRVIEQNDVNDKLLVCGTNAYDPKCKYYDDYTLQNVQDVTDTTGLYKAPFATGALNTAIFSNGSLYAGTVSSEMMDKSVISRSIDETEDVLRTDLRTEDSDSRWLSDPDFISSFDIEEEIFFFLRETAMEYSNNGKMRYSRIAKVCKQDRGGSEHVLENIWTTFLKARIICSIPGDFPFYFNDIQDTFKVVTEENGERKTIFYGVFTTADNSIQGSGICAYNLTAIKRVFSGEFLAKASAKHAWLPVDEDIIPDPRPGTCLEDSTSLSYNDLLFFKSHTLMVDTLKPMGNNGFPLFTVTKADYKLTQIVVARVIGQSGAAYNVLFIGTDSGKVLKVVLFEENGVTRSNLVDEMFVGDPSDPQSIVSLELIILDGVKSVLVGTRNTIIKLNVQRCEQLDRCGCLQDPYCGWIESENKCLVYSENVIPTMEQNVTNIEECFILPGHATARATAVIPTKAPPSSPKQHSTNTDQNIPIQSENPSEKSPQSGGGTTEKNDANGPIAPPVHVPVVDPDNDYSAVEAIAIVGWIVAAILGIFIIGYFCITKARKSESGNCFKRGRMNVSQRQAEEGMKSPQSITGMKSPPPQTTPVAPIAPVIPVVTPTITDSENAKNNEQETPLKREKPPVPQKPKNYAASINDRRAMNDQRASSLNRRSTPHDGLKDVSGELKNMFILSNGSHTQQQVIMPARGGKIAHV